MYLKLMRMSGGMRNTQIYEVTEVQTEKHVVTTVSELDGVLRDRGQIYQPYPFIPREQGAQVIVVIQLRRPNGDFRNVCLVDGIAWIMNNKGATIDKITAS